MQLAGYDSESSSYTECERLDADDADCDRMWDDLCFRCGGQSEAIDACR